MNHFPPLDIALVRVVDACTRMVEHETSKAVSVASILPIVCPESFAGDKGKRRLWRQFCAGGSLAHCASTHEQLAEAAGLVFAALQPLMSKGFAETGRPNVYAYLASAAYGLMIARRCA